MVLFVEAFSIARLAQQIRTRPLPEVARRISGVHLALRTSSTLRAAAAAARATARGARRWGWLDTCLTRSLTAAGLISRARTVALNLGFRPGATTPADGHAWLMIDGERLDLTRPERLTEAPYTPSHTIVIHPPEVRHE